MRRDLKKGDLEYELFNDYWQICKQYNVPEASDEYWISLINAGDEFCKKYNSKYASDIMLAFITSREDIWKGLKKP